MLILDEPTVGLDPNQIIEIRTLIKNLGKHHTVILSSHILQEIEAVCDRIIIINQGQLVADDPAAELTKRYSSDRRLLVRIAGGEEDAYALLTRVPGVEQVASLGEKEPGVFEFAVTPKEGEDVRREISTRLAARNWAIMGMRSMEMTLEDVFVSLTRENLPSLRKSKKGGRA